MYEGRSKRREERREDRRGGRRKEGKERVSGSSGCDKKGDWEEKRE